MLFRILKKVPRLKVLTILPFDLEPHYAQVAHEGVHDPQFWDLMDGNRLENPPETELSREIESVAAGRKVVVYLGRIDLIKGFGFLSGIMAHDPDIDQGTLFVAAGRLLPDSKAAAADFVGRGRGYLIGEVIGDDELESLYGVADLVWCCYAPEYDQASGIFGRAMQYGVPVLVREGSVIARFARTVKFPTVSLVYGDTAHAARRLKHDKQPGLSGSVYDRHVAQINSWRRSFMAVVTCSLEMDRR